MNVFLNSHRQEFKKYLDDICSISSTSSPTPPIPPSYSTPIAILHRLPPTFKEGFPSLPYLIDHSRNFAMLVNLWLDNTQKSAHEIQAGDGDLLRFHKICISLSERTKECLNRAEPAERPSSSLSVKWEELVEQLHGASFIEAGRGAATRKNRVPIKEEQQSPTSPTNGEDYSSSSTSTPITMSAPSKFRHQPTASVSATSIQPKNDSSSTITYTNPFASKAWSGRYAPDPSNSVSASVSASPSASVAASTADDTPPGSSDGLHMAAAPSYPPTLSQPPASASASAASFNYSNPNVHINMSNPAFASPNSHGAARPRSTAGQSLEGSENDSVDEEEYTTALPTFTAKEGKEKDRKDHGFRVILPFQRKRKDKDKDKGKDSDRSSDRHDKDGRSVPSLSGEGEKLEREREREREKDRSGGGLRAKALGRRESQWEEKRVRHQDKKEKEKEKERERERERERGEVDDEF